MRRLLGRATVVTNTLLCAAREKEVAMKRFTTEGTNDQEGLLDLIPAQRGAEEEEALVLSFEGRVAGARTYSRRQALGLVGGSLAGISLLSFGLAAPAKAEPPKAKIEGPGTNGGPTLSGVRGGNWWDLTVEWRCVFQPSVVNHTFQTNWTLMESDFTSDPDVISATVEPHLHSAHSPVKTFIPSQANPSNPRVVSFRETRIWHRDDLDTELGGEELYARVRIGDNTTNSSFYWWSTEQLYLSP
jgi:hypothetical protein